MRSRGHALVWEYWAFGWRGILLCLLAMLGVPLFIYGVFHLQGVDAQLPTSFPEATLHFNLMLVGLFVATAASLGALQTRHRVFTLPISTWLWVSWKLPLAMGTASLMYLMTATLANRLFGADWPLWGPALFYATTVSLIHAAVVSARSDGYRVLLTTAVAASLFAWILGRYSTGDSYAPEVSWTTVSTVDLLTLGSLIASAWWSPPSRCSAIAKAKASWAGRGPGRSQVGTAPGGVSSPRRRPSSGSNGRRKALPFRRRSPSS